MMAARNTIIEDLPQVSCRRARPTPLASSKPTLQSPMSDNFPTPRANPMTAQSYTSSLQSASYSMASRPESAIWSSASSSSGYDSMYDVSEAESEEVEIRISNSVKRRINTPKYHEFPSLVIPSPSEWPTIEKYKSAAPLSAGLTVSVPPAALQRLAGQRVPSSSSAPSLDGSASGDDAAYSSCPSTPDMTAKPCAELSWDMPIQLDLSSLSLLQHISPDDASRPDIISAQTVECATKEMTQVCSSPPLTAPMRIETSNIRTLNPCEGEDELSALSVPSPGGFFASLNSAARQAWTAVEAAPTTSVATEFYDVPFRVDHSEPLPTSTAASFYTGSSQTVERIVSVSSTLVGNEPVTATKGTFPSPDEVKEISQVDELYDEALKDKTAESFGRTAMWIDSQDMYMKAVCEEDDVIESFKDLAGAIPSTPEQSKPATFVDNSPSKKSVRFADIAEDSIVEEKKRRVSPIHDGTFWEGWRHSKRSARARDVFMHRQARAEAEHVRRTSFSSKHAEQLKGNYAITDTLRPNPTRPISFHPDANEEEKQAALRQVERERQALDQMSTASWHVSAQRQINGGSLLTSPIVQTFKNRKDVRILDVHGQVHCSWAWNVAMEHPNATVYTVANSDAEAHVMESNIEGPDNHVVCVAPKPWTLPFENDFFDVVSARNMHSHLRTVWPKGQSVDEWDLTLRECQRVLKPNGYLEFELMDAELLNPDSNGQALGVEFAFNLKTRGYDPCAGRNFLPRLKRAGFSHIKRAWMVLPVADVLPRWVDSGKGSSSSASSNCSRPSLDSSSFRSANSSPASAQLPERFISPDGSVDFYASRPQPVTGSTTDVRAVTGLVGSRMWEQWMLKLNGEMGRDEERCLQSVAKALEGGARTNAAWKSLVGWARKDVL